MYIKCFKLGVVYCKINSFKLEGKKITYYVIQNRIGVKNPKKKPVWGVSFYEFCKLLYLWCCNCKPYTYGGSHNTITLLYMHTVHTDIHM